MPLEFAEADDYEKMRLGTKVKIENVVSTLRSEAQSIRARTDNNTVELKLTLTRRLRDILIAGGLLNYIKSRQ
jgi:aconitate hydratase